MPARCRSMWLAIGVSVVCALSVLAPSAAGQRRRHAPAGGRRGVVVDERLAAVRDAPDLTAGLVQRMGRGRAVAILGLRRAPDGVEFYRIALSSRRRGWIQREALVAPSQPGEDERLARLVRASEEFERIARARVFLDVFPNSPLRPEMLMLFGNTSEEIAARLSRDAARRLDEQKIAANGAPLYTYYLNFSELDRYRREGVVFLFDREHKQFHYDGASWREILRRYPKSPEAHDARVKLDAVSRTQR